MFKYMHESEPEFNKGSVWVDKNGDRVTIVCVLPYVRTVGQWDWDVYYTLPCGTLVSKNGWSFRILFKHIDD